ncbi:MAG: ion transporter [Spirochaetia bacterium]
MRKIGEILETVVVVAILLVLVHTFLEDYSSLAGWDVNARRWIIWAGLGFDLFFTIEFLTRMYLALSNREGITYFFQQRGWIDFLASVPLLLFNSLPNTLALLAGTGLLSGLGSFLNVLKVIKAVRIARILRLMRIVKLFRRIRYVRSPMAQKHIATITTISVSILVFWSVGASALQTIGVFPGLEASFAGSQAARARIIAEGDAGTPSLSGRAAAMAAVDPTVMLVRHQGGTAVWTRYDAAYYRAHFLPGDYAYYATNGVEVFVDERPIVGAAAREGLVFFFAVVLIVLGILFLYAPRFALGISDPIHVMQRGMSESAYNLEVKIPPQSADEDVFALAALYNSVFLPLKDRESAGTPSEDSALNIDEIKDLVDKG